MSGDIRIVLVGPAKDAHDQMLNAVRADGKTTINSSKLINWIVSDYFERMFNKRKQQLCREHFNSRKCVLEAMKVSDPEERRRALQEAAKSLVALSNPARAKKLKSAKVDAINATEQK